MAKIYIDGSEQKVTEICWINKGGKEEQIREYGVSVEIKDSAGCSTLIYKEDIPKLIKALNRAKELGWW
jgi:hypothetical protein